MLVLWGFFILSIVVCIYLYKAIMDNPPDEYSNIDHNFMPGALLIIFLAIFVGLGVYLLIIYTT